MLSLAASDSSWYSCLLLLLLILYGWSGACIPVSESRILCHMLRMQRWSEQSVPLETTRPFESWIWINALSSGEHTVIMLSALAAFVFPDSLLLQDSSGKTFLPLTVCVWETCRNLPSITLLANRKHILLLPVCGPVALPGRCLIT